MTRLEVYLLGFPRIVLDGRNISLRRRKTVGLLAYLCMHEQPIQREVLATLLWPDYRPSSAFAYLRHSLWEINERLGEGWLVIDREQVSLSSHADWWCDARVFLHQSQKLLQRQGHSELGMLDQIAALYQDDFLAGFYLSDSSTFEEWQYFQAEEIRKIHRALLQELAVVSRNQGLIDLAFEYARQWVGLNTYDEFAQRFLIQLLYDTGQRVAALQQYEILRKELENEFGLQPQAETQSLIEEIRAGKLTGQQVETSSKQVQTQTNSSNLENFLPAYQVPFIGRQKELDQITRLLLLSERRMLTIIGLGGMGKTRLAVQVAKGIASHFPDGIRFVPLAGVSPAESILGAIAKAINLNFYEPGNTPCQQLVNYLRDKQLLLVLDNFEHVITDENISLLSTLLEETVYLKFLVTSRISLGLSAEQLFQLTGLHIPEYSHQEPLTEKELGERKELPDSFSALQLFLSATQRLKPDFQFTREEIEDVIGICRIVHGVPLAIELASSWIDLLSPKEILAEIERCLDFLKSDLRDLPERHRSIRAVFQTSWSLLNPNERKIFQALAVFQGGFSRQAALEIANASLTDLLHLADKSLLTRTGLDRYTLHELIRQYTLDQLNLDAQNATFIHGKHSSYYLGLLQENGMKLTGVGQKQALDQLFGDIENIRAAWLWALEVGDFESIASSLDGFTWYLFFGGFGQNLEIVLEKTIQAVEKDLSSAFKQVLLAKLLICRSAFLIYPLKDARAQDCIRAIDLIQGNHQERQVGLWFALLGEVYGWNIEINKGIEIVQTSLAWLREDRDKNGIALALHMLGGFFMKRGDHQAAKKALDEAIEMRKAMGDKLGEAISLGLLAEFYSGEHQYEAGIRALQDKLQIYQDYKIEASVGFTLLQLGQYADGAGDYQKAIGYLQESQKIFERLGCLEVINSCLSWESIASLRAGDLERARQLRLKSLQFAKQVDDRLNLPWGYLELGEIERISGNLELAREYFEHARQSYRNLNLLHIDGFYHKAMGDLALANGQYDQAVEQFQMSLVSAQREYHSWGQSYALQGLGRAALGLGDHAEAGRFIRQALVLSRREGSKALDFVILDAAAGYFQSLREDALAVELAALISTHPASWQESKDHMAAILTGAAGRLSADQLSAAYERGSQMELEDAIFEILQRLSQSEDQGQ